MNSIKIMGVNVYPFKTMEDVVQKVDQKVPLFSVNAEILLYENPRFKKILNQGIGYPDGVGAVMALRKKGVKDAIKIPGCELWLKIVEKYYKTGTSFYLIGCTDKVINQTVTKLKQDFSGINICGFRNGFISSDAEKEKLKEEIKAKNPDIVFIAMGLPRQEFLTEELYKCHKATYMPLGGSFDVYTGNVKRAPKWWIDHKLEFAYRLIKQPSRFKRQIPLLKFLLKVKMGRI